MSLVASIRVLIRDRFGFSFSFNMSGMNEFQGISGQIAYMLGYYARLSNKDRPR